jgi:hypothetical protein
MSYPSPTIYNYRIKQILPPGNTNVTNLNVGLFEVEFSQNGGTTWSPVFTQTFGSIQSASSAIAILVQNEAQFQQNVYAGQIPSVAFWSYPAY